jgi:hypothetical protein
MGQTLSRKSTVSGCTPTGLYPAKTDVSLRALRKVSISSVTLLLNIFCLQTFALVYCAEAAV